MLHEISIDLYSKHGSFLLTSSCFFGKIKKPIFKHTGILRLKREGLPLSLIMCDMDCFKSYNDTYGHQNGDRCLRSIADAITKTVKRSVDVVARYGGEEFAIIMPNTDLYGALKVARSARAAIEQLKIPNKASSSYNNKKQKKGIAANAVSP